MASALKDSYGHAVAKTIARAVAAVHPDFPHDAFLADARKGYAPLSLIRRGRHVADALRRHLPPDYPDALAILMASLAHLPVGGTEQTLGSFLLLPYTQFVSEHGLDHFEPSMAAQYRLTQLFTAEFSLRAFLDRHPDKTLALLRGWARDPSEHVRRLVSEGTRPRLPWAARLRAFQKDPTPVLALLELLRDDESLYVRRSVANNLNDIGKDHPERLVATANAWLDGASPQRQWIVRHALRSAIKRADPGALSALGFGGSANVRVGEVAIRPKRAAIGGGLSIAFDVANRAKKAQRVLVDLRVFYVKANGGSAPKVFKLTTLSLAPGETARVSKSLSLAQMSTRKHYPGRHRVEVMLNGRTEPLGEFDLRA
jgi:3-methyladenine DNA glycosylase AlkC